MTVRTLSDTVMVAGQVHPGEIAGLAAQGVTTIVNNRPDHEEPGQPTAAEIGAAAAAAGIAYRHIPIIGGLSPDQVAAMAEVLDSADGTLLAFCRSGTRSTYLWALAEHGRGGDGAEIMARAAAAGYDLSPLRDQLLR